MFCRPTNSFLGGRSGCRDLRLLVAGQAPGDNAPAMKTCDVIVIGAGGVGTAAVGEVARRGARAIAIDRFAPGHDRGSSHGQTRIIRQAYFEHRRLCPAVGRSLSPLARLEERRGERLLDPVGLVEIGPADGTVVAGVLASAAAHGLDVEQLSADEIERRFPGLRVPESLVGVFERQAGYLLVERAVVAQAAEAERSRSHIARRRNRARLACPRQRR